MPDDNKSVVLWLPAPEDQDYPNASSYLSLLAADDVVDSVVSALRDAPIEHRKAKDILRAARLVLLPPDNAHVASDLKKIRDGKRLSPILMVRGDLVSGVAARSRTATTGSAPATTPMRTRTSRSNWRIFPGNGSHTAFTGRQTAERQQRRPVSFLQLSLIAAVALLGPLLALPRKWHLPVVLGQLLAGIAIGRTGLGLVDSTAPTFTFVADVGFA